MSGNDWLQVGLYLVLLLALAAPLGAWMARVYDAEPLLGLERVLGPLERGIYRLIAADPASEMSWRAYAAATLAFNFLGFLAVYGLQRAQGWLPLNPEGMGAVAPQLAFNTAVSFVTNTNWQAYGGETTLSYLTQMMGLTVQNFVSAATGMAVLAALVRGFARRTTETIGNFWVDLVRTVLYILLPLALLLAVLLVSQGVVQDFSAARQVQLGEPLAAAQGAPLRTQLAAQGPAASQVAIKQLGTNGGGFFNANSAHPYENPTPLSNLLELLAILLIPAALCTTLGRMVGSVRQGGTLLAVMLVLWVPLTLITVELEGRGTPQLAALGADLEPSATQAGGNMEGKEVRFGIANSALWATATTAASNGSVNAMHDSFTPLGGLIPMWLMQLGEIVFGGVGSGLYGMLHFAIVAVFIAGLMIGRTPEYLGKKIEPFEMKMATIGILVPVLAVLIGTAVAVVWPGSEGSLTNRGAHGFSELLYAFSSAANNNGSAFAGLGADTPFLDTALGLAMLFGRYLPVLTTLAIAGSLARKKIVPAGVGTLKTDGPLFVVLLAAVVIVVGALSFIPALALGPIVEHLRMSGL